MLFETEEGAARGYRFDSYLHEYPCTRSSTHISPRSEECKKTISSSLSEHSADVCTVIKSRFVLSALYSCRVQLCPQLLLCGLRHTHIRTLVGSQYLNAHTLEMCQVSHPFALLPMFARRSSISAIVIMQAVSDLTVGSLQSSLASI